MLSGRGAGDSCSVDNRLLKAPHTIVENFPFSLAFSGEKEATMPARPPDSLTFEGGWG